ncbi:MAG: hypothetical protein OXI27_06135 [Thaumarchaeota archaeon]|nr:hypothetical protein [Nitrososphaerota archaeon]
MGNKNLIIAETAKSIGTALLMLFSVLLTVYFLFAFESIRQNIFDENESERIYLLAWAMAMMGLGCAARVAGKYFEIRTNNKNQSSHEA